MSRLSRDNSGADFLESPSPSSSPMPKMSLHVGVLHYTPFRRAHENPQSSALSALFVFYVPDLH